MQHVVCLRGTSLGQSLPSPRAKELIIGRAAYETAVRLYPRDEIQYRDGGRIIARSDPKAAPFDCR
jgi:hypothetical protein